MLYQLSFHVPETHVDSVKQAIFAAGAGVVGNYACCSWQTLGEGNFMPLEGHQAFIGETGQLTTLKEYKVETVCEQQHLKAVIAALKLAHPYETPSYQIIALEMI